MSEIISKVEALPSAETSAYNRGFDPDCRFDKQLVEREYSSTKHELYKIDPDIRARDIAFKGFTNIEPIADIQKAGTCWAESLENVIQLVKNDKNGKFNGLSEDIVKLIADNPSKWEAFEFPSEKNPLDRWNIDPKYYPKVLGEYGVEAKNVQFSHETLQKALSEKKPVILFGDVKHLDKYEGKRGGHALVAVDWEPDSGHYVLLDSNFKNVYKVSPKELERFAKGQFADNVIGWVAGFFQGPDMTVVQDQAQWSDWRTFVDGKWRMYVNNVEVKDPFSVFDDFVKRRS